MATWSPVIIIIKIYKNVKNCQKMPKTGKIILNFFIIFYYYVSETIPKIGTSRFHTMFGSKNVKKCPKRAKNWQNNTQFKKNYFHCFSVSKLSQKIVFNRGPKNISRISLYIIMFF